MTPAEAHKILSELECELKPQCKNDCETCKGNKALKTALIALERQIPMKPAMQNRCPRCSAHVYDFFQHGNVGVLIEYEMKNLCCVKCGQKIDWSDTE